MSALREMMLAMSRVKMARAHLRAAREEARKHALDHLVLRHQQALHAEVESIERTAHLIWKAEVRRTNATKKHGTTGTGPAHAINRRRKA